MPEVFDFDPVRGIVRYVEDDGRDLIMHSRQDCTAVIERAKKMANDGKRDGGIKKSWWHVADVPDMVWLEIREKYNCDIFSPDENEFDRFLRIIETDYPWLKTTHKKIV